MQWLDRLAETDHSNEKNRLEMKGKRMGGLPLFAALALICAWPHDGAARTAQFIWLSDLHFNPTANPKIIDKLAKSDIDQWQGILQAEPAVFSRYTEDSNWTTFCSALEAAKRAAPKAEFTVVTGDLLVHRFREKFEAGAAGKDSNAFRQFATKAMLFVALQLRAMNPGKPVYITLGNNDSECGDYELEPGGLFLRDAAKSVLSMLGQAADETSAEDWRSLGSYNVRVPGAKKQRVVAVNSVYFSPRYRNACSAGEADPAAEEMQWLEKQLEEARQHKEKVWLIFHIPPGIDGYATARLQKGTPGGVVWMWKPRYTEQFDRLQQKYRNTIAASLAGHEHMDDFRLVGQGLVMMTPGVSPVVGQNPAFRVVNYEKNGSLTNANTYYLSNLQALLDGGATAEWKAEYNFRETWGEPQLDSRSFHAIYRRIETEPEARTRWMSLYSVLHPEGNNITTESFPYLYCATGNATEKPYEACMEKMSRQSDAPR